MPVHNADISAIFDEIANLLEIQAANPFRIRAYRNAARTLNEFPQELQLLAQTGKALVRLDLVVGAVHSRFGLSRIKQTERILRAMDHPHFTLLAHPSGWLKKANVLNTRPLAALRKLLKRTM